jgi:hypothetical protein
MLKAVTLLSMLVAAPAFAAADSAGLEASRSASPLTAHAADAAAKSARGARAAEAAAWKSLVGGLMRSSGQVLADPERSMAALATPDLGGEIERALQSR